MGYGNSKQDLGNSVLELRGVFQSIIWPSYYGHTVVISVHNLDFG